MNIFAFQDPLKQAKKRTGRDGLGVSIKRGKYNVVEVFFKKNGSSTVDYLVRDVTGQGAIDFINHLQGEASNG